MDVQKKNYQVRFCKRPSLKKQTLTGRNLEVKYQVLIF